MQALQAAMQEANRILDEGNRYVTITVKPSGVTSLKIGIINSYNEREQIHAETIFYQMGDRVLSTAVPVI